MKEASDCHVHTSFSGDCKIPAEVMIQQAIQKGIAHLCLTDHMDYDYVDESIVFEFDTAEYFNCLRPLREKYREQLDLGIGVELGLQPYLSKKHHNLVFSYPFDFVIGSIHIVNYQDPYYPSYFQNRSEEEAYREYFQCVLQNLEAFTNFDVFGHLDYVIRYGPTRNQQTPYAQNQELIDEILRILIRKEIGLEINTSGYKYGLGMPNPSETIIRRYHEMGGRIITFGSDAHDPEFLGFRLSCAAELAKACGFSSYFIFKNRTPVEIGL